MPWYTELSQFETIACLCINSTIVHFDFPIQIVCDFQAALLFGMSIQ